MARLAAGDHDASRRIVDRFASALIARAKSQLGGKLRAKVDPEDAVQSAFWSFFRRQADGQFDLVDWDNLWALLLSITMRKCLNLRRHYHCGLRDIGREAAVSQHPTADDFDWKALDGEPTPEETAILVDELEHLLDGLSVNAPSSSSASRTTRRARSLIACRAPNARYSAS
jgi:DNA-directed RNA polymerase specialized sigma24 family protein